MKEINIAKVLVARRREKGITQKELANYIGVSKASVSKWETEQSCPDITLLPVLASYFNISIDALIDYRPQMAKEDIRKLYRRLSADFTVKPFDSAMEECRGIIKKYYSCFPLLLQMGILFINHIGLLQDRKESFRIVEEAKHLFVRVKEESGDPLLAKKALHMEALACIAGGDPQRTLDLLEDAVETAMAPESLLASAYQMTGRVADARAVLQAGIYQSVLVLFSFLPAYLQLNSDNTARFEEVLRRASQVAEAFDLKHLHPASLVHLYINAAQGYLSQDEKEKALEMLEEYAAVVSDLVFPLSLHGDDFFDLLDTWVDKLDLGSDPPRNDKSIREDMAEVITLNPSFAPLAADKRFQAVAEKLRKNC